MKKYYYDHWEIYSSDVLPLESSPSVAPQEKIVLYRDELDKNPMVSMISETEMLEGNRLSIDSLYGTGAKEAANIVAINLNWFEKKVGCVEAEGLIRYLKDKKAFASSKKKATLLALGDVGSTLAIGLKLIGGDVLDSLGICDINASQKMRWEMELNQIVVNPSLRIEAIEVDQLFDGDLFIFCASGYVPKVGEEPKDVRMAQYEVNAKLVAYYAKMARSKGFTGIFAVVSDPVDLLCRKAFIASNEDEHYSLDYKGLLPEQIVGFGLGVMDGRAKYYSDRLGYAYRDKGRVYGPHGKDLVVAVDVYEEDQSSSLMLTDKVVAANLEMRAIGFKPFIAPALSSGAHAIVSLLGGKCQYSAHFLNGIYWGAMNHMGAYSVFYERLAVSSNLRQRIQKSYDQLEEAWQVLNI